MHFLQYLVSGPALNCRRNSYPSDTIFAKNSTFSYLGWVELIKDNGVSREETIDYAVKIITPSSAIKQRAQATLENMKTASNILGSLSLIGIGAPIAVWGDKLSDKTTITTLLALTALSFLALKRSNDAAKELSQWNNPTKAIAKMRKEGGKSFSIIKNQNLKNKCFTEEEVGDIFHQSLKEFGKEYEETLKQGDLQKLNNLTFKFIEEDILSQPSVEYAFGLASETIPQPRHPNEAFWFRKDMHELIQKFNEVKSDCNFRIVKNSQGIEKAPENGKIDIKTQARKVKAIFDLYNQSKRVSKKP